MANQDLIAQLLAALAAGNGTEQATATPAFVRQARAARATTPAHLTRERKPAKVKAPSTPAEIGAEFVPANGNYPDAVRTFKVSADGTRYAPRIITLTRLFAAIDAVPAGK